MSQNTLTVCDIEAKHSASSLHECLRKLVDFRMTVYVYTLSVFIFTDIHCKRKTSTRVNTLTPVKKHKKDLMVAKIKKKDIKLSGCNLI